MGQLRLKTLQLSNVTLSFSNATRLSPWMFLQPCPPAAVAHTCPSQWMELLPLETGASSCVAALPILACPCALELSSLEMRYSWHGVDEMEAGTGLWEDQMLGTRDFFLSLSTWARGRALGHLRLQCPLMDGI